MAKIIKVGSQNPTFTSQAKKSGSIQTQRNSNEITNPFKFTNFEGNTLQFADVFEGFKPTFKASPANKLRIVASSVTGSMNKMKSDFTQSIVNVVRKVREGLSVGWDYAKSGWDYAKNTSVSDIPMIKQANEILNRPINIPVIDGLSSRMAALREGIVSRMEVMGDRAANWTSEVASGIKNSLPAISFNGKQKYSNMSVAELEANLRLCLAEGGINE